VHFRTAELLEQRASVQRVERAVEGMQVVGIMQASRERGSQQPFTPYRVFVAQMRAEFWHVIEDSLGVLGCWSSGEVGLHVRDKPDIKPHVLPPVAA
jgi:hypothetical protein